MASPQIHDTSPLPQGFIMPPQRADALATECDASLPEVAPSLIQLRSLIKVDGAKVPYTVTTADTSSLSRGTAALMIGGFYSCEAGYLSYAEENASHGLPTITFEPPRHQGMRSLLPSSLWHPERLLPHAAYAIASDAQKEYGIRDFDLVGHSMGGKAAYDAAGFAIRQMNGPNIRSIALIGSAGVTGHNVAELAVKLPKLRKEMVEAIARDPRRRNEILRRGLAYGLMNPYRTAGEALRVSNCEITAEGLEELSDNYVNTMGLFYARDGFFPADRARARIGNVVQWFMEGQPAQAGHLAPHTHPAHVAADHRYALQQVGRLAEPPPRHLKAVTTS